MVPLHTPGQPATYSSQTATKLGGNTASAIIPTSSSKNQVLIHVCDEAKKRTQDFRCDKTLLLATMKYFEKYLSD